MRAADLMTREVLAFGPDDSVREIAAQLSARGISGAPVVDERGCVIGMVSEGDLLRRAELGADLRRSWMDLIADEHTSLHDFTRIHGRQARDIMSRPVVTIGEHTPIAAVAGIMDRHKVKRLPVVRDGMLIGIVSRADLIRCLAQGAPPASHDEGDQATINARLHEKVMHALSKVPWASRPHLSVAVVGQGIVEVAGTVSSQEEKRGIEILIEEVPGISGVRDMIVVAAAPKQRTSRH